jgi:CopA family copper-resistance protein
MTWFLPSSGSPAQPTRRRFVQGLVGGGALLACASYAKPVWALTGAGAPMVLEGREFHLTIDYAPVDFTGSPRLATVVNGSLPAPVLRWREGETVTVHVTNRLAEDTSLHWHGILVPNTMDGVPGMTFPGIKPGATFTYRFTVRQSGTYWYHSHSGMQEQTGIYGAIIIDPAQPDPPVAERDHVVMFSDWSDEDPMAILRKLKVQGDYYNDGRPTAGDFFADVSRLGWRGAFARRSMWNGMRMNPTDFADVSAATYTYLVNGTTPAGNWQALFRPGERVRLRCINAAAQTFFDVRIPGLKLTVVAADGQPVRPVEVDEFRFGPGETYDIVVTPDDRAYTLFAQTMDRSGYARATLAPRAGMEAAVPAVDQPAWLSEVDMMGAAAQGDTEGMGEMAGMAGMTGMANMSAMHHDGGAATVRHARSEYGPGTDMRIDRPRVNLDDPGVNLRANGRRVLTLADLESLDGDGRRAAMARPPEREIELHLTGNMERYQWSIDGVEFAHSKPVQWRQGERLRVVLVNDTMMIHSFHLHGCWSDLESPQGGVLVRRHTLPVQPAQRISYRVSADEPGRWAFHCHLMFHMATGMFREVRIA